ncbi:unnamed protein product [Larinioides sclopetarius]|uniref:Dehydrogenase/reductase SDR family member 11 n=1 Tax=Larinioides sclopetarius TaxID=280406 RepID=A0AAV1YPK4_9ARAC
MERWKGRVVLVTGASSGIGADLCRTLVQHGMTVVGCARRIDRIWAISEEDQVKNASGKLIAMKCDLSQESEILKLFDDIRQTFGHLDVCINNAGLGHNAPLLSGSTEEWRNMLNVNIMAVCICTQQTVKLMRERSIDDGQIINISSTLGHRLTAESPMGLNFLAGTKFMIRALTEGLRKELKALNSSIRVASISPGIIETEALEVFLKNDPTRKASDFYSSMQALQPKDIADSVLYILEAPQHVEVHDVLLRPYDQSS